MQQVLSPPLDQTTRVLAQNTQSKISRMHHSGRLLPRGISEQTE